MSAVLKPLSATASPAARFNHFLVQHKDQLAAALPKHLTADRMSRLALTCFSSNKQLQECEPRTVFAAVVMASQLGLEIGIGGQAYLVPYYDHKQKKMVAQFIPGWQGIVDLISRSGRATVWTGAVFHGDHFEYAMGDSPFITHRPAGEDDPDKMMFCYAVGRVNGSQWPVIEVWSADRLEKHFKKYNKVGDRHYAYKNWEMYCRKVVLLQVCKYMPKSVELHAAITADHAAESGRSMTFDGEFVTLGDDEGGSNADDLASAKPPQSTSQPQATATQSSDRQPASDNGSAQQADQSGRREPPSAASNAGSASKGQIAMIRNMAERAGLTDQKVCEQFQIADLDRISGKMALEVIDWLQQAQG